MLVFHLFHVQLRCTQCAVRFVYVLRLRTVDHLLQEQKISVVPGKIPDNFWDPERCRNALTLLSGMFQSYFSELFQKFSKYCISDVTGGSTISVFLKDHFLDGEADKDSAPFLKAFCETQIFKTYEDGQLRALDQEKSARHTVKRCSYSTL